MRKFEYVFKMVPLTLVEKDPNQPRKDFGTDGDENRLLLSIKELGMEQALSVSEVEENRYILLDGHRRYMCAKKLKLEMVPCRVYPKMSPGEFELRRFELQNNRRTWKPFEKSETLERVKNENNIKTNRELALLIHLSETMVSNSLLLRQQKMEYIELMNKHKLPVSYHIEFVRLKQKLRKIGDFDVDEIIVNLFERVENNVITTAKDFRKLGRIFLRASANKEELHRFLSDPDMTVFELDQRTLQSGFSLLIEEIIQKVAGKRKDGIAFSSQEKTFLIQLKELLNKAL